MLRFQDLRIVPARIDAARATVMTSGNAQMELGDYASVEFDPVTAFVHAQRWRGKDGSLANEFLQFLPSEVSGILVPGLTAHITYHAGAEGPTRARLCDVLIPDRVALNEELSPDHFRLSVPAGTNVVDFRKTNSGGRPLLSTATGTIDDVRSYADDMPARNATPAALTPQPRPLFWILIGLHLTVGAVIAVVVLLRRRRRGGHAISASDI
jgi:hypothetical protein